MPPSSSQEGQGSPSARPSSSRCSEGSNGLANRSGRGGDQVEIDGFELVGATSSQGKSTLKPRKAEVRPPATPPEPAMSSAEVLRSLIPDRAQLERERLARARQRQTIDQLSPSAQQTRINNELHGRPPAIVLDGANAAAAIIAEREANSVIKAALQNVNDELSAIGIGGGPSPSGLSTAGVGVASASNAASSAAPASNNSSIYWWENLNGMQRNNPASASPSRPTPLQVQPSASPSSSKPFKMEQKPAASSARIRQRSSSGSPEIIAHTAKKPKIAATPTPSTARPAQSSLPGAGASDSVYDPYAPVKPTDRFWHGTIKHSYNRYAPADKPGVKLASLVQPRGTVPASRTLSSSKPGVETRLEEIIVSTYCFNLEWLANSIIPTGKSWADGGTCPEVTFIADGSSTQPKGVQPPMPGLPNWTTIYPIHPNSPQAQQQQPGGSSSSNNTAGRSFANNGSGWQGFQGVMHCKFMILFYPGSHMRFILLSGNMCDYDWERIENTAFIQDFPMLSTSDLATPDEQARRRKSTSSPLGKELLKLFNALTLPPTHSARTRLRSYDLSGSVGALVLSAPQRKVRSGWAEVDEWGVCRLGSVVRSPLVPRLDGVGAGGGVGLQPVRGGVNLEAQGSSLGELRSRWLQHFHVLASGVDPTAGYGSPSLPLSSAAPKAKERYGAILYPPVSIMSSLAAAAGGKGKGTAKAPSGMVAPPDRHGSAPTHAKRDPPRPVSDAERPSRGAPANLLWPPVRICFPGRKWVIEEAVEGAKGAGTFFGKKKKFEEGGCKHLFYQPVSKRGNFMMHAKTLLALQPGFTLDDALRVKHDAATFSGSQSSTARSLGHVSAADAKGKGKERANGGSLADSILIPDSDDEEIDELVDEVAPGRQDATTSEIRKQKDEVAETGDQVSIPETIGWVYTGSHNFTPSAWGTLTEKASIPTLSMSNWELGIVLPLFDARDRTPRAGPPSGGGSSARPLDLYAHISTLARNAIVYKHPLERYKADDVPWDQFAPENKVLMDA